MDNRIDDEPLMEQFLIEQRSKTAITGKLLAAWGIPMITVLSTIEWFTYRNYYFVFCRLILLIPLIVFLISYYTIFNRKKNLIIPLHIVTISAGLVMMTGLTIVKFRLNTFTPAYMLSSITGGTVVFIFLAFLFAAGARKYLKYILPLPILSQVLYTLNVEGLDWKEITFFVNPLIIALGVIILAAHQEKLAFNEYKQRILAEKHKH